MIYKIIAWWALKNYWKHVGLNPYTIRPPSNSNDAPYISMHLLGRTKKMSKKIFCTLAKEIESGYSSDYLQSKFEPLIHELWDDVCSVSENSNLPQWIYYKMNKRQIKDIRSSNLEELMEFFSPDSMMLKLMEKMLK
ncbi:MAG: hypothetical protein PHT91_03720 [Candidatus Nanoarchaeia archaeon]|nr:hypothetical protein [Candidatus Nanoarchaeia archaeon]MDD5054630.1 hypothetical protein [Candidatus Nanoarchaeia archaeon]MDD5499952.1 hypothetical protein [Candidatus Nanoarchaeia archaeon]